MSGQLGDMPPPAVASPKKQPPAPAPSSTPAPAPVDSKPVVEAAAPTQPAPEAKVEPETVPTPALNSPDHDAPLSVSAPPPDCTPQVTPQSEEQKQPLAADPVSEPVIHPEQEAPISESVAESIPAIPVDEQQQISCEKITEEHPHPETEPSDADQPAQSATVSEIPAVQQQQSGSEKATEDPNVPLESDTQNLLTNTGLDKTTVPTETETEPNPKITQSETAAPLTDNEKIEPTPEKLPGVAANSSEPQPASIPEADLQEVPPQLDPKPDFTATNVKEETISEVELGKPIEKPQIDEAQATTESQTPTDTVETAPIVDQTEITTNSEAASVEPDVKNEVTAEIKADTEPIIEKPVLTEDAPPPQAEVVQNVAPVAPVVNSEVPKPDDTQQELKPEPAKCVETESSPQVSENKDSVSASAEESKTNIVENKPIEKEEGPSAPDSADKSPPDAVVEDETKAPEKETEEKPVENKVLEKVVAEEEIAKQNIPERADVETSVEIKTKDTAEEKNAEVKAVEKETVEQRAIEEAGFENKSSNAKAFEEEGVLNNAAAERAIEVKADEGKASEEETPEKKTVENANDKKLLEEKVNKAESSPEPVSADTANNCPVMEKEQSEPERELAPTVAKEIPKEEILMQKETEPESKCELSPAEGSLVETVSLSEKSEDKEKPMVEAESEAQKEEKQTPSDTILKADDTSENTVVTSEEKVTDKEPAQSVETVLSSGVISETQVRDKACEEKLIQDEKETSSQETNSTAENQHEIEGETLALTGNDEKQLEKVSQHNVLIKEEAEKPLAGNIQEPISVSETNAVCDKDCTAQIDVGKNTTSEKDEVSEAASENRGVSVSVASVPVAEPEIPASVVTEQDKDAKENTGVEESEETKAQPVGKLGDHDAVTEVTIEFSRSSGRLYNYLRTLSSTLFFLLYLKMYLWL